MAGVPEEPEPPWIRQQYVADGASVAQKIQAVSATAATGIAAWKNRIAEHPGKAVLESIVQMFESVFVNLPVRLFWMISDYGSKTWPIVGAFILLNVIFTFVYLYLIPVLPMITPTGLEPTPLLANTTGPVMGVMQTTMILFSITDIATKNISYYTMFFALVHVILGYFILAALVTRFAVMFQNQSP